MFLTLALAAALIGVAVALLVVLSGRSRRGEMLPDGPGTRTLCRFEGAADHVTAAERVKVREFGTVALGHGVAMELADTLGSLGVMSTKPTADERGWGLLLTLGRKRAYVRLGSEGSVGDVWLLEVIDPNSGAPGAPQFLSLIDSALRRVPGVTRVRWYARRDLGRAASDVEHESPLDP